MHQELEALKAELADTIKYSTEQKGSHVVMDENGPAGFTLITAIIDTLEALTKEIDELKKAKQSPE